MHVLVNVGVLRKLWCVCGFVSAGEQSGASLFQRELEAQLETKRDEQVLLQHVFLG